MPITEIQAAQVARLLNDRNQLTRQYTAAQILETVANYICRIDETGRVLGCIEIKKVQWYQIELLHLTVAQEVEGKGYAKALLCEAERHADVLGARLLQCTIREDNSPSRRLFERSGYHCVSAFFNEQSGNNIHVLQKVLSPARAQ